ncbi:hypothetical protein KIPB_008791 [Kipferlia bialata]|uniref:Uncharacterized protein n=1 Tax=Kipferlia bialata TaxID=797122 RepID=A0A9K3GL00_9EUKA|nr:hypothetical protein KIPB_008791 [Kipferlia bialata]|eukprot:g8791.t1
MMVSGSISDWVVQATSDEALSAWQEYALEYDTDASEVIEALIQGKVLIPRLMGGGGDALGEESTEIMEVRAYLEHVSTDLGVHADTGASVYELATNGLVNRSGSTALRHPILWTLDIEGGETVTVAVPDFVVFGYDATSSASVKAQCTETDSDSNNMATSMSLYGSMLLYNTLGAGSDMWGMWCSSAANCEYGTFYSDGDLYYVYEYVCLPRGYDWFTCSDGVAKDTDSDSSMDAFYTMLTLAMSSDIRVSDRVVGIENLSYNGISTSTPSALADGLNTPHAIGTPKYTQTEGEFSKVTVDVSDVSNVRKMFYNKYPGFDIEDPEVTLYRWGHTLIYIH